MLDADILLVYTDFVQRPFDQIHERSRPTNIVVRTAAESFNKFRVNETRIRIQMEMAIQAIRIFLARIVDLLLEYYRVAIFVCIQQPDRDSSILQCTFD